MSSFEQALPTHATQAQQRVLERIAVQRERLRARRAARMQSQALAEVSAGGRRRCAAAGTHNCLYPPTPCRRGRPGRRSDCSRPTPTDPVGGGRATSRDAPAALTQKTEPVMASSIRWMVAGEFLERLSPLP